MVPRAINSSPCVQEGKIRVLSWLFLFIIQNKRSKQILATSNSTNELKLSPPSHRGQSQRPSQAFCLFCKVRPNNKLNTSLIVLSVFATHVFEAIHIGVKNQVTNPQNTGIQQEINLYFQHSTSSNTINTNAKTNIHQNPTKWWRLTQKPDLTWPDTHTSRETRRIT